MTATLDLVEQARAIENPRPVPGVSGVWGLELGGESRQVTQAQLTQIRAEVQRQMRRGMNRANVTVQGGIEGHLDKIKLRKDQYIVSRVSDLFALQSLPDFKIWSAAVEALARAETDLQASKLTAAASDIVVAETSSQAAMKIYLDYHEGTISGAGRAATTLEWTRDIAFAIDGVLATVVTGGAVGGVLVGTGITTAGTVAQQAMEVHLDMRREVDWSGIAIDAALNVVLSLLAGRLGQYLAKSGATAWMVRKVGSAAVVRIIENLVMGRAQGVVQTTLRTIIANVRGERGAMTGEQLVDTLVHQLTTSDNLFHDILIGEISHHAGEVGQVRWQQEQAARRQSDQRQQQQQQQAPPVQNEQQQAAPPVQEQTPPPVQEPQLQSAAPVQEPQLQSSPPVQEPQPTATPPVQEPPATAAPRIEEPQLTAAPPVQEPQPTPAPPVQEPQLHSAPTEPVAASRPAGGEALELPPGVRRSPLRNRALELIGELPSDQRALVMEAMRRLPPAEAGPRLSDIGRMPDSGALADLLNVGTKRTTGEAPAAGRTFADPEQMAEHLDAVSGTKLDEPTGRTAPAPDPTEVAAEQAPPLEGLGTIENRPPARITPEQLGQDRSALRDNLRPNLPEWARNDPSAWNAHHVIPVELQHHEVLEVLRNNGGWDHNAPSNGVPLPTRPNVAGAEALPVHQITPEVIAEGRARLAEGGGPVVPMPDAQTMRDLQGHPIVNERARQGLDAMVTERLPDGSRLLDHPDLLRQRVAALQQDLILEVVGRNVQH